MALTMYSATVPLFVRQLGQIDVWLDKAEAFAASKKFEPQVFMAARLAPDMLAFPRQVQIACDAAKFCIARLAGVEAPKFADEESTFAELRQRVHKTLDFVRSVPGDRFDGADERLIDVPIRGGTSRMSGETYLKSSVLPNFFFHLAVTYALLRKDGVDLGKADFLGPPPKDLGAAS